MKQLALFEDFDPAALQPADRPEPAAGAQLDLFEDRTLLLSRAREALIHLEATGARKALREAFARYPDDVRLADEVSRLENLAWRVEEALRTPEEARPEAFLAIAQMIAPSPSGALRRDVEPSSLVGRLWVATVRRAATEAIARAGDATMVRGVPPGELLLLAGDFDGARASLERALRVSPRARLLMCLGECARQTDDVLTARQLYLSALRANPYDIELAATGDEDVRALPGLARHRFEIEREPVAWTAAVGVVTGVLQLPALLVTDSEAHWQAAREGLSPPRREALESANAFLEALRLSRTRASARNVKITEVRRTMKRLCPTLFDVVMGRAQP